MTERALRRILVGIALSELAAGAYRRLRDRRVGPDRIWTAGALPVVAGLAMSMVRDLLAGRLGVDAVAFVSMSAALLLGQPLAGVVVAVMYAGGNLLEDFAVARAEHDLKSLVDRAPRIAHRRRQEAIEDVAIDAVAVGDALLVRAGEVIPVDGAIVGPIATLDESALTGEPIPVRRGKGEPRAAGQSTPAKRSS